MIALCQIQGSVVLSGVYQGTTETVVYCVILLRVFHGETKTVVYYVILLGVYQRTTETVVYCIILSGNNWYDWEGITGQLRLLCIVTYYWKYIREQLDCCVLCHIIGSNIKEQLTLLCIVSYFWEYIKELFDNTKKYLLHYVRWKEVVYCIILLGVHHGTIETVVYYLIRECESSNSPLVCCQTLKVTKVCKAKEEM